MALPLSTTRLAPVRTDRTLVSAARRGDDRAFEALYARYRERIAAFISSRVHDHGRAEDIAQEVFISALRRLRTSDQPIAFKPWIYEVAKNACVDEFRRGTRSREVQLQPDEDLVADRRAILSAVPTPPAAVENKQRLDDLRGAFGILSETHHQLLVMREFEGLSYEEIGDRLGMTRQMVESGLFRARRKLSEEYDELASGRRCLQVQTAIAAGSAQTIKSLGIRERRRLSRHLAHCQPCWHTARLAGVDEALLKPRRVAGKIAALLPFPLWRWPWHGGRGRRGATATGAHSGSSKLATVGSLRNAASLAEPASSSLTLGQAAAAAAALAIAGAGGGIVSGLTGHRGLHPHETAALSASSQRRASTPASSPPPIHPAVTVPTFAKPTGAAGRRKLPAIPAASKGAGAPTAKRTARSHTASGLGTGPTTSSSAAAHRSSGQGAGNALPGVLGSVKTSPVTNTVGSTVASGKRTVSGAGPNPLSAPARKVTSTVNRTVGSVLHAPPAVAPAPAPPPLSTTGLPPAVSGAAAPLKTGAASVLPK